VEKNKLTGLVPSGLLERSKTGSLSLRYASYILSQIYINSHYTKPKDRFATKLLSSCNLNNNKFSNDN